MAKTGLPQFHRMLEHLAVEEDLYLFFLSLSKNANLPSGDRLPFVSHESG